MPDVPSREEFTVLAEQTDSLNRTVANLVQEVEELKKFTYPIPLPDPDPEPDLKLLFDSSKHSMTQHCEGGGEIVRTGENSWIFRSNGGRAEFQGIHTAKVGDGKHYRYEWTMYAPPNIWSIPTWLIHGQLHRGWDNPPFSIQSEIVSGELTYIKPIRNNGRDIVMSKIPYSEIIFPARFQVDAVWDKTNGEYYLRINGALVAEFQGDTVIKGDKIYPKFGVYDGGPGDVEVGIGDIKVYEVLH